MVSFSWLVVAVTSVAGVLATPVNVTEGFVELIARGGTPSSTGTSNGYYYSWRVNFRIS
jgi:endo-1,4-beta-xylanase